MYVKSCIYKSNWLFEKTRDYEMRENRHIKGNINAYSKIVFIK
jgi:hypothetical protein